MNEVPDSLLGRRRAGPVTVHNENGRCPDCRRSRDNSTPHALDQVGVPETECEHHIAWHIGVAADETCARRTAEP